MTKQWSKLSLEDAGVVLLDCDHRTPPASETGLPYVAIPQIRNGRLDLSAVRLISREHFEDWTRKTKPVADDVIIVRRCNSGESAWVPPATEIALGQNLVIMRTVGSRVVPGFLRWLLSGPEWWEQVRKFINVGAVFDSLRCGDIPKFVLTIPPVDAQRSIAHVLGALDNKIELNRRTNETLEAIARAIFRSWFVNFDPVRAKMEGRQPVGMDAETARLFPDRFDAAAASLMPEGWSRAPLDSIASFLNGLALQRFPAGDGPDLPVIKIAELRRGDTTTSDRASSAIPAQYVVENGNLLFSWSGSLEVALWCGGQGALNQHLFKVTSANYPRWFVHGQLLLHLPDFRAIAADKATTMGHIQRAHLTRASVVVPTRRILEKAAETLQPIEAKWIEHELESRTLAALRDTLLPKLLSGELRVPEAERAVEAAL